MPDIRRINTLRKVEPVNYSIPDFVNALQR